MLSSRPVTVFSRAPTTALARGEKNRLRLTWIGRHSHLNEKRPGHPPCGEPAGPCFSNFVVPRFAG